MRTVATLIFFLVLPTLAFGQEFNAGFVQGLWYSDQVFADKPVRIYVAIRNNTNAELTGRVEFLDNDKLISRTNVNALDGRIIESWADWTPSYGSHHITALLSRIELHQVGSTTKAINVTSAVAEDVLFVDFDTDNDGVGNRDDTDDDGDGYSDEDEAKNGTDPLVFDTEPEVESDTDKSENGNQGPTDGNSETEKGNSQNNNENSNLQGIEQYLTPSPARAALTGITQLVETSKRNLDTYRDERSKKIEQIEDGPELVVDDNGFGEITRSSSTKREVKTPELKDGGILATIISLISLILSTIYSGILWSLSLYLSHPLYPQITLLLLILFGLYKLARKFGERPKK